jgi:hypothetical protein
VRDGVRRRRRIRWVRVGDAAAGGGDAEPVRWTRGRDRGGRDVGVRDARWRIRWRRGERGVRGRGERGVRRRRWGVRRRRRRRWSVRGGDARRRVAGARRRVAGARRVFVLEQGELQIRLELQE